MNIYDDEILKCLTRLKEEFSVFEIKAEFESEGTRMDELIKLKDICSKVGLPIILKIGGAEALTDVYQAISVGVKAIVAPMIETSFALKKYLELIKNNLSQVERDNINFAFNMETITAFENLDSMLNLADASLLSGLTVGRVDLSGSLGTDRSYVDSEEIFDICKETLLKAKEKGLECAVGGAVSADSIDFISKLYRLGLLDKFETRKVVFHAEAIELGKAAISEAIKFELLWLKSKQEDYKLKYEEDIKRIKTLEKRQLDHSPSTQNCQ
jgi:4-hydroxy-2-oxoheptanedioate aldolase